MAVANIDSWLQAETQQRISYQGLCDLAIAFDEGIKKGFTADDVRAIVIETVKRTRKAIFESSLSNQYGSRYFIEVANPSRIETTFGRNIGKNFEKLLNRLDADQLYNYLCRCWQVCTNHKQNAMFVFEKFMQRLGKTPASPSYPDVEDLDNVLVTQVVRSVLEDRPIVSKEMLENVERIRSKRLSRPK